MTGLVTAAVLANVADFMTYMRASPAVVATQETSPLPHVLGQTAGGLVAKLVAMMAIAVIVVAFRRRPRTRAALLVVYTFFGVAGAVVNSMFG